MDLLREYEFESLSFVDNEYDNPVVKTLVHAMITEEMKTFIPNEMQYLSHLPYPKLNLSPILQTEYNRVKTGSKSSQKIDMTRYVVESPHGTEHEKNVDAWKNAVNNSKSQYGHQQDRLMNIELASEYMPTQWLNRNNAVDNLEKFYSNAVLEKKRKISEVNSIRKTSQSKAATELDRINRQRVESINKQIQIIETCNSMLDKYPQSIRNQILQSLAEVSQEN